MANRQSFRLTAGEDRTLTMTATDSTGAPINLTGATINWTMARLKGNAPSLIKTGTILSASAGTFTVTVGAGDTNLLRAGTYFHQGLVTIAGSVKNGVEGNVLVSAENQQILDSSVGAVFNNNQFYGSRAEAILTKIGTNPSFVETFGYYAVGDGGGGTYQRVGSAPANNEYFQSLDGAYWALSVTGQDLNIRQFGAKDDGSDCAVAINTAFAYIRALGAATTAASATFVYVPAGQFTVQSGINATSIRNLTWGIRGPGVIVGQTNGTPVIDFSDSRYAAVRDLTVIGSTTRTPSIGILCAIISGGAVSDEHNFYNVSIDGNFTVAAYYNYGSEDFNGSDMICRNNQNSATAYCAVLSGYNSLSATSAFKTLAANVATSFNDAYIVHGDFRKTGTGPAVFIERSDGLALVSGYAVSPDSAAVVVNAADSFGNEDLYLDVHCEASPGLTDCVRFDGAATHNCNGLYFHDYAPQPSNAIFRQGSSTTINLSNINININRFPTTPSNGLFDSTHGGTFVLKGGVGSIPDTTYLNNVGTGIDWQYTNGSRFFSGSVGFGQSSPSRVVEMLANDSANSSVSQILRLTKITSGTPASGIGAGLSEVIIQTGASTFKTAATMNVVATDVTGASEDFDYVINLMVAGSAASEVMRLVNTGAIKINSVQVIGPRDTGWTAMTGSPDKATAYATSTVTLAQLAGRVAQLQATLTTHGLIGA